jgi:Carboxylesterase family
MKKSLLVQLIVAQAISAASVAPQQYVHTKNGVVKGHNAANISTVFEYLGLPYAQAPVGSLRFAPPKEPECQDQTVVYDAATWVIEPMADFMIDSLTSSSPTTALKPPRSLYRTHSQPHRNSEL